MYLAITEARILLVGREYEECARMAKIALQYARSSHSQQGIDEVEQIYLMLSQLVEKNPYVANLGVELNLFPG